jgi:DNA-binding CsgD family transcriptional regulator
MQGRFVGRSTELDLLRQTLERAAVGQGGVVLVAGPAGIGKSTLVREAVTRFAEPPWQIARGFCADDAGAPPLWPWDRALRSAGLTAGEPATATGNAGGDAAAAPGGPAELAAARFRQLTGMAEGLAETASRQVLLVVLEDLHWADNASLDLLRQVAQQSMDSRLAVIGTVREPAPDRIASALADLTRYGVTTVRLRPFTTVEIGQYLDGETDPAAVASRTGGLPLLVAAAAPGSTPGDLRAVVDRLLRTVPTPHQPALIAAAVLSGTADEWLLSEVTGQPPQEMSAALTAGLRAGLLSETDGGYRFTHALLQDAMSARASAHDAAGLHFKAAQVLAGKAPAAVVAAHWRRAGQSEEALRAAAHWSQTAAGQAERVYAIEDAIGHLTAAMDALSQVEDAGDGPASLLLDLARAEYLATRYPSCIQHCSDAAELARQLGQPDLIARAALVLRNVSFPEAAYVIVRLGQQALSYPDLDPVLRARVLAQVAAMQADDGQVDEARRTAAQALDLATHSSDPQAELDAIRAQEMNLNDPGDVLERLRLADRAVHLGQLLGDPVAVAIAHSWRVKAGYQLARLDIVDGGINAIGAIAMAHSLPLARWHFLRALAARAVLEGHFAPARSLNGEAAEIALRSGDPVAMGMSFVLGHQLASLRGDPGELLPGMLDALRPAPTIPLVTATLAQVHLLLGDEVQARQFYSELLPALREPVRDLRWGGVVMIGAELAIAFGDRETGELLSGHLRPWTEYPGALGTTTAYFVGSANRLMGGLAALRGRPAEAETLLTTAIQRNIGMHARPHVVLSKVDLGQTLLELGKAEQAKAVLAEAETEAKRLDMPGPMARAAKLRVASADTGPLSPREREVAELAMRALSNRQIANQLVLSERTVESHVRSILTKLGCANRAELIARHKA